MEIYIRRMVMNNFGRRTGRITAFGLTTVMAASIIGTAVFAGNGDISISSFGISSAIESYVDNATGTDNAHINTAGVSAALSNYYIEYSTDMVLASKENIETILKLKPATTETATEESTAKTTEKSTETETKSTETKKNTTKKSSSKVSYAGYKNLGVANVTNYLNVREEPGMDGKIIGKLPMNAGCEIISKKNGWYKIESGEISGYVSAEYLLTGTKALNRAKKAISKVATVTCDQLMVREEPNTNCTILSRVAQGENLEVVKVLDGWVKIKLSGCTGYVCADYVKVHNTLPTGVTIAQLSYGGTVSNTAVDLIEYAKQFLGNPYVYGGTSLTNGTDCSGFTMRIFGQFGYSLNRSSGAQTANGTPVDLSQIQPGDLLFYSYGGSIGHVAIYIGGGQIIHASTERTGITIGNAFYQTPTCARRVIN